MQDPDNADLLKPLRWPLRLTRAGLWGEQIVRSGWPLWTVLLIIWALLAFGAHVLVSRQVLLGGMALSGLAVIATAFWAVRRFQWPTQADAMVRLDTSMPGRPITAALDDQAIGTDDPASQAVWLAHKARMRAKLDGAKAVQPDLRVSRMDAFGLRYLALMAFVMALGFGTLWRDDGLVDLAPGTNAQALASGPAWEVWIEPPVYTGKPSLYLNEVKVTELSVPKDSQMTVRLYGEVGSLSLTETVSGVVPDETNQPQTAFSLPVIQNGTISINDEGGTTFDITVVDDNLPTVAVTGNIERTPDGEMQLPFEAADDYGVERGKAEIVLDLAAVDRRHGLVFDPEPVERVIVDLPMPISGNRETFAEILIENLSKHPWANLPVEITLSVEDGKEQQSVPYLMKVELPGRRFFQPIAKALIEQRRDLIWNRENADRIGQILRAVTYEPEGFFNSEPAYLTVRRVITRLEILAPDLMDDEARDEIAEMLWNAAVVLEEGSLNDALEALRRAQEKLADAMRDGASDEEISELMQELQEAMREYMERLAEQQQQDGQQQQQAENQNSQEITQDQLQEMLDEIERLMQEGEMDQAQALLDQLMEMMQNMQVAEGQQGQRGNSPGEQAMEGLQETLRDQQGLSDEAFRDLQEQFNPDAQAGENQDNEGRNGGQGRGQSHEGEGGEGQGEQQGQQGQGDQQGGEQGGGSLADRQQALREELERQQQNLPGGGTPEGDAAREALDRAGEAMDRAEQALRDGQTADALGAQSDAMEALREGMRDLSEMMAQQQQQGQPGGQQQGDASRNRGRDPLGRDSGTDGAIGQDGALPSDLDARQRSRELLDEIRRRSGEQERPEIERDYLRRLLDRF
jgi:uncharacterized protein (TIGR02302 family)